MKTMIQKVFLMFAIALHYIPEGQTFQCYSYECFNLTNQHHPSCAPPRIITCPLDPHSPLRHPNRCMTQRITAKVKGTIVHQEIRGCSDNLQCGENKICKDAKQQEDITDCKTTCCQGDLCNREGPVARHVASENKKPSGSDLSCYACSNGTEPGKASEISCVHPIVQQCGNDPLTNQPHNRCITIKMSTKMPGPRGLVTLYQEMRHCGPEHLCEFCEHANMTGNLNSCHATCCQGNLCNGERMMTSTSQPLSTMTTISEEKFARQGAHTDKPTTEKANIGVSSKHTMHGFQLYLAISSLLGLVV